MNHRNLSISATEFGTTILYGKESEKSELEEVMVIYALVLPAQ